MKSRREREAKGREVVVKELTNLVADPERLATGPQWDVGRWVPAAIAPDYMMMCHLCCRGTCQPSVVNHQNCYHHHNTNNASSHRHLFSR